MLFRLRTMSFRIFSVVSIVEISLDISASMLAP